MVRRCQTIRQFTLRRSNAPELPDERWFAYLTADLLQRGDHRSVQALEREIRGWVAAWNENPKPFIWSKTAEEILESLGRLLQWIKGAGH